MENEYKLYQNENQQNLTVEPMKYIAKSLDLLEKRYWLAGGTLLGKLSFVFEFEFELRKNKYRLVSSLWFNSVYK